MAGLTRRAPLSLLAAAALAVALASTASAQTAPLPVGAVSGSVQNAVINATACPSAGNCVAVGSYDDSDTGDQQGLIEAQTGGGWSAATATLAGLSLDTTNASGPNAELHAVACTSSGNCVAVGDYDDPQGHQQGLIETETDGTWKASEATLAGLHVNPAAANGADVRLDAVSCTSAGSCVAVGTFTDASGHQQALVETEANGSWSATAPDLTGLVAGNPDAELNSISCPSAGNCVAVGIYSSNGSNDLGLIDTETNGAWSASEADLGNLAAYSAAGVINADNQDAELESVSCASAGNCTAVGYYIDANHVYAPLLVSEAGADWRPATTTSLPADADLAPSYGLQPGQNDLYLNSVSCASAGNCTAVGSYDSGRVSQFGGGGPDQVEALALTQTDGDWAQGIGINLPAPAASGLNSGDPNASLDSVACTAVGSCVAAGSYDDAKGNSAVLVADQNGGLWNTASSAQDSVYTEYFNNAAQVACAPGGYCAVAGDTENYDATNKITNYTGFLLNAPGAVGSPSATVVGGAAMLSWSAPADDGGLPVTGYTVTATDLTDPTHGGQSVTTDASATAATLTGLTPGDRYTFTITADSLLGGGIASSQTLSTAATPATTATAAGTAVTPQQAVVTATVAQVRASLRALLRPRGRDGRLKAVLRHGGYTFTYHALESGRVTIDWYRITGRGKHRHQHLVARGSARVSGARAVHVRVRLTRYGRVLLEHARRLRLTTVVRFTPTGGRTVTHRRAFTLR